MSSLNKGGVVLNITGTGFNSQTSVLIDGNNCPIISKSYSLLQCIVPFNVKIRNFDNFWYD